MSDKGSIDYYVLREQRARGLAEAALNPQISAIHREMATHYSALISVLTRRNEADQKLFRCI